MKAFKTLLLREWMQHRIGWLLLAALPLALVLLLLLPFGEVTLGNTPSQLVAAMTLGVFAIGTGAQAWLVVALQAPGLARRDAQDRSIELWRSLPVGDATAISATLVAHHLLMPLAVMCAAGVAGLLAAVLVVVRGYGWQALDLHHLFGMFAAGLPRVVLGSVLASLWASALLLPLMAASAWLKRWGVPVLVGAVGAAGLWLDKAYHQTWLLDGVRELFFNFAAALVPLAQGFEDRHGAEVAPDWFWLDAQHRLADLGTPLFAVALLLAATGFGLLVLKRQRG
jgi:ABC-2 type transport system permease protein